MGQSTLFRILALVIAAVCVTMVVGAMFGGVSDVRSWTWKDAEDVSVSSLLQPALPAARVSPVAAQPYACPQCRRGIQWGARACPGCGWSRRPLKMNQVALPCAPGTDLGRRLVANTDRNRAPAGLTQAVATGPTATLPSPRAQGAAGKEFIEGHWLGLEVIPLTPELATEYQVPKGAPGVLVDEITLEAAESGILAGDMVEAIDGRATSDLRAFFLATLTVQEQERARVGVNRRGSKMTFVLEARNTNVLGFAQMEAAQPIRPGALSPHRVRSKACTDCHIIMLTGGQLPTDAGDILPTPPPIAAGAIPPHRERGRCSACHVMK